jgi:hypothetical protein
LCGVAGCLAGTCDLRRILRIVHCYDGAR